MQKIGINYFDLLKNLALSATTPIEEEFYVQSFDEYSDLLVSQRKNTSVKNSSMAIERGNLVEKFLISTGFSPSRESLYEILKPSIANLKVNTGPRLLILYFLTEIYYKLYYPITNSFEDQVYNLEFLYNLPIQINYLHLNEFLRNGEWSLSKLLLDKIRKNLTIFWPVILLPTNLLRLDLTK